MSCLISILLSGRYIQQVIHIRPDIVELLHIGSGLLVSRIGFPFLFQKSGIFLPQRFNGGQLCDPNLVKVFLRRLVQKDFRLMSRTEFFAKPDFVLSGLHLKIPLKGNIPS